MNLDEITTQDNGNYEFLTDSALAAYREIGSMLITDATHTDAVKAVGKIIHILSNDIEELHILVDILRAKARHPD